MRCGRRWRGIMRLRRRRVARVRLLWRGEIRMRRCRVLRLDGLLRNALLLRPHVRRLRILRWRKALLLWRRRTVIHRMFRCGVLRLR